MSAELPPDSCANCGGEVPPGSRSCPHCGAEERTGWRETSIYDGLDLPDDEPVSPAPPDREPKWYWLAVGFLLLLILVLGSLSLL